RFRAGLPRGALRRARLVRKLEPPLRRADARRGHERVKPTTRKRGAKGARFPEKTYQNFRDPTPVNPGPQARRICFTEVRTESNRPLLHVPVSIAFSRGMKDAVFRSVANLPTVAAA